MFVQIIAQAGGHIDVGRMLLKVFGMLFLTDGQQHVLAVAEIQPTGFIMGTALLLVHLRAQRLYAETAAGFFTVGQQPVGNFAVGQIGNALAFPNDGKNIRLVD